MSPKEKPKDKVIVRFDKSMGVYQGGERASFNWAYARKLVKGGVAHYDDPDLKQEQRKKLAEDEAEDSKSQEEDVRTHGKSIEQVQVLIDGIGDSEELERLWAGEVVNPQHDGGRRGVLKACRERAAELKEAGDD